MEFKEALEFVKEHCENTPCPFCFFTDVHGNCRFENCAPRNWRVDKIVKITEEIKRKVDA